MAGRDLAVVAHVRLDTREFNKALKEYQAATQKDWAYVSNRQALNVAIKTAKRTPLGNPEILDALTKKKWWPKFVAKKIMSEKGVRVLAGKSRNGRKRYKKIQGAYTRDQAREVSKALIKRRKSHIGFIRSGWIPTIKILTALKYKAKNASIKGVSKIQNPKGDCVPAKPGLKPLAIIINNSKGAEKVGKKALQGGIMEATVDMRKYIADQGNETAARFNGKRHH